MTRSQVSCAPVALFAYNRPGHLSRTLEALAAADRSGFTPLWLFCDGPADGLPDSRVEAVRVVANDQRWRSCFAAIRVEQASTNRGLANSVIAGVSSVLERHDRVIVLEDDLLVAPDFLSFMNACLEFYGDDPRIGSISGFCPLAERPSGYRDDVMAVPRNCSHGWATWADRWQEVDWKAREAPRLWREPMLRRRMNIAGSDRLYRLKRQIEGRIDSWSIRFGLWQILTNRLTIYPVQNRIRNIGFDGSGVHTRAGEEVNGSILAEPRPFRLSHVDEDPDVLARFRKIYSGSLAGRLKRQLALALAGPISKGAPE